MCQNDDDKDGGDRLIGGSKSDHMEKLTKRVGGNWDWLNAPGNGGKGGTGKSGR